MVQKPFEYPEEQQEPVSRGAEGLADSARSLPAPAVINTMARLRWLRLYARALGVWRVLQALRSASAASYDAGEEKKQPTADATDVLDTAERIRRTAQQEAALGMRASVQQSVEQQDVERRGDVSAAARPTAAGAEKPARESHRARTEAQAFLDYNAYVQTEVVKKAMLVVQKPTEYPEVQQEQELGGAEDSTAAGGPGGTGVQKSPVSRLPPLTQTLAGATRWRTGLPLSRIQRIKIRQDIRMLHDMQQLVGSLQWIRNIILIPPRSHVPAVRPPKGKASMGTKGIDSRSIRLARLHGTADVPKYICQVESSCTTRPVRALYGREGGVGTLAQGPPDKAKPI
ncbi:hypothetical protein HGM15179_016214 [Zosterops borbonicus]|uniref:Uncharacterized protein n=1 Tax=Zosterops borbonicus TaxID=364589 RepID=A0A8K1G3A5_9PASS|nr:hypothetical protein HGM15179_016214 [Zosterops borbonicus]